MHPIFGAFERLSNLYMMTTKFLTVNFSVFVLKLGDRRARIRMSKCVIIIVLHFASKDLRPYVKSVEIAMLVAITNKMSRIPKHRLKPRGYISDDVMSRHPSFSSSEAYSRNVDRH